MSANHIAGLHAFPHTYEPSTKKLTVPGLHSLPPEILDFAEGIEILDLSHGHLTNLPEDFGRLGKLRVLFMSHNDFTEVPAVLANCPSLRTIGMVSCRISSITSLPPTLEALIVTNNQIQHLPASIGNLAALKKLTLTGNVLQSLPDELLQCENLELVRLAANQFTVLPTQLLQLPNMAWYTDAGNPGSPVLHGPTPTLGWQDVHLAEQLGASSKNTVYAATITQTGQQIAVKVFGADISADGVPDDEMRACLYTSAHPALIQTLGEIVGAPDNKKRLAMARIPRNYISLGGPPTLASVTRDTYTPEALFSQTFIVQALQNVASALEHLHQQNLMHGDIYAHNILVNHEGKAFLADLGAASFYEQLPDNRHELAEVHAFGHLMQELLDRREPTQSTTSADTLLEALAAKCLLNSPTDRPSFTAISMALKTLL